MLNLANYSSIGAALKDAMQRFADEVCLIEADREREKERLSYREFNARAIPLARATQDAGFAAGDRARILITEYPIWRQLSSAPGRSAAFNIQTVLVSEAPPNADLAGAQRWEEFRGSVAPTFVPRERKDIASIVYSSGTGGRPKGCMMTHENYLVQCVALTSLYPFWPGVRYLSILPTNHAIDFMVGFFGPFTCGACVVHLRTLRPEFVREAFMRYKITYVSVVPLVLKNLQKGLEAKFAALPPGQRKVFNALVAVNKSLSKSHPRLWLSRRLLKQVHAAFGGQLQAIIVGGAFTEPQTLQFFYDLGIPVPTASA